MYITVDIHFFGQDTMVYAIHVLLKEIKHEKKDTGVTSVTSNVLDTSQWTDTFIFSPAVYTDCKTAEATAAYF